MLTDGGRIAGGAASPASAHDDRETPLHYMRQLDGVRAIAVMLVFVEHWAPPIFHVIPAGALGVHLFFALSGFLITSILLRCRSAPPGPPRRRAIAVFYVRRFLRIFPLYYALLLVLYVLDVEPLRRSLWWHVCYLSNFYLALHWPAPGLLGHLWSLSAEEQFYLCLPWLVLLCPTRALPLAIGLIPVTAFVARLAVLACGIPGESIWLTPLSSSDSLGLGSVLAWGAWQRAGRIPGWSEALLRVLAPASLAILVILNVTLYAGWFTPMALFGPSLLALFGAWVVWRAARGVGGSIGGLLASGPLVYLGRISYGLYLFHKFAPPAYHWLLRALALPRVLELAWFRLPMLFLMTVAVASLSWRYFEKPLLDLKGHLPYAGK